MHTMPTTSALPKPDGIEVKTQRITLRQDQWRQLRVMAAEDDVSVTTEIGALLQRAMLSAPRGRPARKAGGRKGGRPDAGA